MVQGKRVLVTGSSTGIGEQIAYEFARMGAHLLLTARREKQLKEVRPQRNATQRGGRNGTFEFLLNQDAEVPNVS